MKKQNGITLISLAITIVVMTIIAGITINIGTDLIKEAKLQDLITNMLLIQVKAKECVEEVNFQKANVTDQTVIENIKAEHLKGSKVADSGNTELINKVTKIAGTTDNCYYFTEENLNEMGLRDLNVEDYGYFVAIYDIDNISAEIINTVGYEGKYKLEDLKALQSTEESQ